MKKLRLDVNDVRVESFSTKADEEARRGTIRGFNTGALEETCFGGCTDFDNMCTGDCTGIAVECYTQDPLYADCTGGNPCTGRAAACTHGACSRGCETAVC